MNIGSFSFQTRQVKRSHSCIKCKKVLSEGDCEVRISSGRTTIHICLSCATEVGLFLTSGTTIEQRTKSLDCVGIESTSIRGKSEINV